MLLVCGVGLALFPQIQQALFRVRVRQQIQQFSNKTQAAQDSASMEQLPFSRLYQEMQSYNARIFAEKQAGLCDAWSYEQTPFDFEQAGLEDEIIGCISIEAMDIALPLYAGATKEHLQYGAAVLGQTSMPLGGENTNCVVAAHRGGLLGGALFRDIQMLEPGDLVLVDNLWEQLCYEVDSISIISPDDIDAVKIQPGLDLLTLITCHPYPHNYQRYVVYCRRVEPPPVSTDAAPNSFSSP